MKLSFTIVAVAATLAGVNGFVTPSPSTRQSMAVFESATMAESGVPPATSESSNTADVEIPTNLPSDCGMDYIPLATMLATGQLAEADQVRLVSLYGRILKFHDFCVHDKLKNLNINFCIYFYSCCSSLVMLSFKFLELRIRSVTSSTSLM